MPQQSVASKGSPVSSISPGAELFSLCQSSSPDGELSPRELGRLAAWLDRSVECDVPSWALVCELIAHAVRAGRVAPADLQTLGRVLEPSFPPELRRRRPHASRLAGSDGMAYTDDGATERARNDVLASACFMVAGCHGRRGSARIPRQARAGEPVLLVPERPGQGVGSAVEVRTANGRLLGFVPAQRAGELAPLLDRGARYRAHLISAASGAQAPVLIVQAFVYRGDAVLGFAQSSARRVAPRRLSRLSWNLLRAGVALGIATAAALALRT